MSQTVPPPNFDEFSKNIYFIILWMPIFHYLILLVSRFIKLADYITRMILIPIFFILIWCVFIVYTFLDGKGGNILNLTNYLILVQNKYVIFSIVKFF